MEIDMETIFLGIPKMDVHRKDGGLIQTPGIHKESQQP